MVSSTMWAKHKLRQKQNLLCNGNRDIGYISIDDDSMHRIGLRGRKAKLIYLLIGFLAFLALANTFLNLMLIFTYKLYSKKNAPFDFWSDPNTLTFNREVYFNKLSPSNSEILNVKGEDMSLNVDGDNQLCFESDKSERLRRDIGAEKKQNDNFILDSNGTIFTDIDQFALVQPLINGQKAGKVFFSGFLNDKTLPFQPDNIILSRIYTPKIVLTDNENVNNHFDGLQKNFKIESTGGPLIIFKGNQGASFTTTNFSFNASKDLKFHSKEGSIVFNSVKGNLMISTRYLPFQGFKTSQDYIDLKNVKDFASKHKTYKLCVCMPGGQLFTVPIQNSNTNCLNGLVNVQEHPCRGSIIHHTT